MTIAQFIKVLQSYPQDKEIEIECPNGLLVSPKIKNIHEKQFDFSSKIISHVISWRD